MMTNPASDTIVALSSGPLPAAIAIIRTSGPRALAGIEAVAGKRPTPRRASLRTLRDPRDGTPIDRALVIFFPGPDSSTGEDIVEYQCHGSKAVVAALISVLIAQPGIRAAEAGEFTRRALANGRIDLTQAEGLAELLEAESEAQRKSALIRAEGGLRRRIEQWRRDVIELSAEAEVAIDYADEEDGGRAFEPRSRLAELNRALKQLLAGPRIERLRDGLRLVVAGPPNAGKSSLVNALAGEARAIVTATAGTTRDLIEIPLAIGGVPLTLVDTAGLRDADDEVERIGVALAHDAVGSADLLLWLGTSESAPVHPHCLLVASKSDLRQAAPGLPVSVISGEGLATLQQWIVGTARQLIPSGEQPGLNQREGELVAECHRALTVAREVSDPILIAEELRLARHALDRVLGRSGVEEFLDSLFGRFCLGK